MLEVTVYLICVCVNRSPGRVIGLKYEMGEFQASVRDCSILRHCRLLLTTFIPACPTFLIGLLGHPIIPLPTSPPPVAFNVASPLSLTRSPHPLPAWYIFHLGFVPTRQPLPLISAPRSVYLLPPPFPMSVRPPFLPLAYDQVPVSLWVVVCLWYLRLRCVPAYLPPCVNHRLLSSSCIWFRSPWVEFFACKGEGPRRLHSLAVTCPSTFPPPLLGPVGAVQGTPPPPPPFPPFHPPLLS